ncbi:hypothetical protein RXV88_12710 [Aestuariicoccus sp. MJ-SS9]|nr:hypothetical protein [Aestuariicoccus sp. MJ-SS9]
MNRSGSESKIEARAFNGAGYRQEPPVSKKTPQLEHVVGSTVEYKGKTIRVVEAGYVFGGTVYPTFDEAKARIDKSVEYISPTKSKPPYAEQLGVNPNAAADSLKRS